jgi:hypothetical protein
LDENQREYFSLPQSFIPFRILILFYFILLFSQSFYSLKIPNLFRMLIQIYLGMYLDEIMAKEEGCFLATTQGNISAIIQGN